MRRRGSFWFCAGLQMLLLGAPIALHAQPAAPQAAATGQGAEVKAAAQNKAREARKLADKGQHEKALQLFKEAYETYQEPGYLYNIGIEYQALGREPEAFDAFERFLKDVEKIPPEFVADANQQQRELRKRLGELEIKSTQEGAHVLVDDRDTAQTPLDAPIRVRAGQHRVAVRKDGFEPFQTTVNVAGGGKAKVEALMRPIPVGGGTGTAVALTTPTGGSNTGGSNTGPGTSNAIAGGSALTPDPGDSSLGKPNSLGGGAHLGPEEPVQPTPTTQPIPPLHLSASVGIAFWVGVPNNPQPSTAFSLGAGYRVATLAPGAEFRLGGKFGATVLSEQTSTDLFIAVVADPMMTLTLVPGRLFGFAELGLGMLVISGVNKDSVLLKAGSGNVTGALSTFELRPALGVAYALSPAFAIYASPGVAWSPSPSSQFAPSSLMTVELAAGALVRL
jgi:hypothetical protein